MVRCITWNVFHMRQFCRFFYFLAWFNTVEFNRLSYPNNKMCDDAVFADRFRYQLTMLGIWLLTWLSRLIHVYIAYEIDTDKIIAAFLRISYCLHDLIRSLLYGVSSTNAARLQLVQNTLARVVTGSHSHESSQVQGAVSTLSRR